MITDGVFSMDGDIGPVDKLAALAEKYGAIMMVDDAHASGVLGRNGRGSVDHFGDARQGGCAGGHAVEGHRRAGRVCVRDRDLIDYLYHRARPFLFSTSHPPSVAATCIAAFDILETGAGADSAAVGEHAVLPGRAAAGGLQCRRGDHAGDGDADYADHCGRGPRGDGVSRALFDEGVMGTGIAFPTVPEGKARIRLMLTSEHTQAQLDQALETLERVAKRMGIFG